MARTVVAQAPETNSPIPHMENPATADNKPMPSKVLVNSEGAISTINKEE